MHNPLVSTAPLPLLSTNGKSVCIIQELKRVVKGDRSLHGQGLGGGEKQRQALRWQESYSLMLGPLSHDPGFFQAAL